MSRQEDQRRWVLAALDEYEGRLVRYALRLVGDLETARDVVQHTFLRLCDERPEAIGECLAQWLYTVCRNRSIDVLRVNGRERTGQTTHEESLGLTGSRPWLTDRNSDPAHSAEHAELYAWLRTLVEQLPSGQREAIDLWAEGFSYAEISRVLDRHEGHVRVLVHRGLTTIRQHPQVQSLMRESHEIVPPPRAHARSHGLGAAATET
jgi:RNA polymerase sigma-70 factor (ECF subfamily)